MNGSKMRFVVPILVIVAGITWLLNILEVIPGVDWVWTIGLGAVGVLMLVVGGVNKMTIVAGPFFDYCGRYLAAEANGDIGDR